MLGFNVDSMRTTAAISHDQWRMFLTTTLSANATMPLDRSCSGQLSPCKHDLEEFYLSRKVAEANPELSRNKAVAVGIGS